MPATQQVAVVTGASRGIGLAIAARLVQDGYQVWALARDTAALATLGAGTRPLTVDVADVGQVTRACAAILEGPVPRVLVNNAGIAISASLAKTSIEEFDRVMAINCRSAFLFCKELMPAMAKAGGGRVINVASSAALKGQKYTSAYTASKHALLGLTRALASEYATRSVTVNAVCPGWTETDMVTRAAEAISSATGRSKEASKQVLAEMNPIGRLITPEEVAEVCALLASPGASGITGAAYTVDGGLTS